MTFNKKLLKRIQSIPNKKFFLVLAEDSEHFIRCYRAKFPLRCRPEKLNVRGSNSLYYVTDKICEEYFIADWYQKIDLVDFEKVDTVIELYGIRKFHSSDICQRKTYDRMAEVTGYGDWKNIGDWYEKWIDPRHPESIKEINLEFIAGLGT